MCYVIHLFFQILVHFLVFSIFSGSASTFPLEAILPPPQIYLKGFPNKAKLKCRISGFEVTMLMEYMGEDTATRQDVYLERETEAHPSLSWWYYKKGIQDLKLQGSAWIEAHAKDTKNML